MEIGDIIPPCHTQNGLYGVHIKHRLCKKLRHFRTCLFQALFAAGTIANDR